MSNTTENRSLKAQNVKSILDRSKGVLEMEQYKKALSQRPNTTGVEKTRSTFQEFKTKQLELK